jgi:Arc/MetJ-type ribon-helix-helix transcriptional regulator
MPARNAIAQARAKSAAAAATLSTAAPPRPSDEKITINLGCIDLGQIDLLVQEGFYGNRSDCIRTAIRNQLAQHAPVVQQVVARQTLVLGMQHFSAAELRAAKAAGQRLQIRVLGLASIAADVTPALALASIESVQVLGVLQASPAVKAALAGRIR